MVKLDLVEETEQRLVFRMGACALLRDMTLCTLIAAVASVSLTLFLRSLVGIFAFVFIAFPGLICVICGFFGCANARQFTFIFDRPQGNFVASAGGASVVRRLQDVRLVYIERECSSGGIFGGGDAPSFAAALLFADGHRCRLEGGVSITGSGKGPEHLQEQVEKIRSFVGLPQHNLPLLSVNNAVHDRGADPAQAEALSRWLSCQGISPRLEPPLLHYEWVEPPEGPVRLPGGRSGPSMGGPGGGGMPGQPWASPPHLDPSLGPVVIGRPQHSPQPRHIQVVIPEGTVGQSMVVMAPDGSQVTVAVPADMRPGQTMTIQY